MLFVIMLQLRPGEGSSKTIEVDTLYSPHIQQQPQVRYCCRRFESVDLKPLTHSHRLASTLPASSWTRLQSRSKFKSFRVGRA
jgi:hypothetical protein